MKPIYLYYNAPPPLDPAVVEAMLLYLREHFGKSMKPNTLTRDKKKRIRKAGKQEKETNRNAVPWRWNTKP